MNKLKNMIPYLVVNMLAFYLLPLLIKDTGAGMLILLVVFPFICFVCAFIYGFKNSFSWLYSIIVAVIFIPTIFIFYNESAKIYIAIFFLFSAIGSFIGMSFSNKK